jgi:uncharacterized protein (TIGR02246 family)
MTLQLALAALGVWTGALTAPAWSQEAEPQAPPSGAADAGANDAGAEDPAHQELRDLRDGLLKATEAGDINGMLAFLTDDVVVTFMDGHQCRGKDEVRAYFEKMLQGEKRLVDEYNVRVEVAGLTKIYGGDTGVAHGMATSEFHLTDGRDFTVTGPWTATTVWEHGTWKIAAFHSSADMFHNPILDMVKEYMIWVGIGALILGFILGLAIAAFFRRGKAARTQMAT